jgi:hypothetical protein
MAVAAALGAWVLGAAAHGSPQAVVAVAATQAVNTPVRVIHG